MNPSIKTTTGLAVLDETFKLNLLGKQLQCSEFVPGFDVLAFNVLVCYNCQHDRFVTLFSALVKQFKLFPGVTVDFFIFLKYLF